MNMVTVKISFISSVLVFIISINNTSAAPLDSLLIKNTASRNAILFRQLEQSDRESKFSQTDSLYKVLDNFGVLNAQHYLNWARTKEVMGDYTSMAGLYCRVSALDVRLVDIAFRQMARAFENVPADSIRSGFGIYQKCALSIRGIDTMRMALWFADFYARHGMDAEELRVLQFATVSSDQLVPRLLDLAREQYGRSRFEKTILPARVAFGRSRDADMKNSAARLVYQSFQALHKSDSALVWLGRTEIASDNARIDAIGLYQMSGQLAEAGNNIAMLAPSFKRDTLEIRQRLFAGDTKAAMELAEKLAGSSSGKAHLREALLWKMRTLLFSGRANDLTVLFDSQTVDPSWEGAREVLDCRLMFQRLSRDPAALTGWSRLEYDIFTGKSISVAELFAPSISKESRTVLLLRLIKDLFAKGEYPAAQAVFNEKTVIADAPDVPEASAEYRYLHAETLVRNGMVAPAQEMLSGIIEDSPTDIYSEKARILLRKLKGR